MQNGECNTTHVYIEKVEPIDLIYCYSKDCKHILPIKGEEWVPSTTGKPEMVKEIIYFCTKNDITINKEYKCEDYDDKM